MRESNIVAECMVALSKAGCTVFRNNTGALPDRTGRIVRYGLAVGSSDVIGWTPDGRFLAVECKTDTGRATEPQDRFIAAVNRSGGRAGIARSPDQCRR